MVKPFLKWVGGKSQILKDVTATFPKECNSYREIFIGGGSVLLETLSLIKDKKFLVKDKVYAYDLNDSLIYTYKNIQTNYLEVYNQIRILSEEYNTFEELKGDSDSKESYYYEKRVQYNSLGLEEKRSILGSSLFIFLNKTCFRGMYRVGPRGFNVPFGSYKNVDVANLENLTEVSTLIKDVIFEVADFSISMNKAQKGDFLYLDPPYAPENSKSFVGYNREGFDEGQHTALFNMCKILADRDVRLVMSNSNVDLVRDSFEEYDISVITCKRSINSKNPGAKTEEVLIKI